jgi:A/G-specific adenine glycosylase
VLSRHCGVEGWPGEKKVETQLWALAEGRLPSASATGDACAVYTQAIMDLGATVCTRSKPDCAACPVQSDCVAFATGRTAVLPAPRPVKAVPERNAAFLLLQHGNDILLEKRPPSGIWGGLWCPPQFESREDALAWCEQQGLDWHEDGAITMFTHTFTHFRLHIMPVRLRLARKPSRIEQPGRIWMDNAEAVGGAIPTPVRRMLRQL